MKIVIVASGPGSEQNDLELIKNSGLPVMVTNSMFRVITTADYLYAGDAPWWYKHINEVKQTFKGQCWSNDRYVCKKHYLNHIKVAVHAEKDTKGFNPDPKIIMHGGNSGYQAIGLAHKLGYKEIILYNFACCLGPDKEKHCHDDHPGELNRYQDFAEWIKYFNYMARDAREQGLKIINCSRLTVLKCFDRKPLIDVL